MDTLKARVELKRMSRGCLFKLVADQRISNCLIGAKACGLSLRYKGIHFCVSELIGEGCLVEKLKQWEKLYPEKEGIDDSLAIFKKMEIAILSPGKKPVEFKVYYRDDLTRSMVYLGAVTERRKRERRNNLGDLLKKAIKEYAEHIENPSKIFLLGN